MYATSSRSIARAVARPAAGRSGRSLCSFSARFSAPLRGPVLHTRQQQRAHATRREPPPPPIRVVKPDPNAPPPPPLPARNVAILGGGLTGLTAAWYLARAMPSAQITLYEASGRLGGWIDTEKVEVKQEDGAGTETVYLERAARMVKPLTGNGRVARWDDVVFFDLVDKLGLAGELEWSKKRDEDVAGFLYYPDHLVEIAIPQGKGLFNAVRSLARYFKMLFEPVFHGLLTAFWRTASHERTPREDAIFFGRDDMSIGDYYSQLHGTPDVVDRVFSAISHGTTGGDIWKLSMASSSFANTLYPPKAVGPGKVLVQKWDNLLMREHLRDPETFDLATQHLESSSIWFRNGFSTLTDALGKALASLPNVTIRLNDPVTNIKYVPGVDQVQLTTKQRQQPVAYDKVISTLLAKDLVAITGDALPALASETAVTIMVINLWYPTPHLNFPHNGFGYLIPQAISITENPSFILGVIFDSDRESPLPTPSNPSPPNRGADSAPGTKLTVLMGGHYWTDLPPSALPDEATAIEQAKSTVARHLRLAPDVAASAHGWAKLCRDCLPQQLVHHRARMRDAHFQLRSAFAGRLAVAGGSYQPPGVLGALRAGRDVGLQVADAARPAGEAAEQTSAASVGDTGLMRFDAGPGYHTMRRVAAPLRYGCGAWVDEKGGVHMMTKSREDHLKAIRGEGEGGKR